MLKDKLKKLNLKVVLMSAVFVAFVGLLFFLFVFDIKVEPNTRFFMLTARFFPNIAALPEPTVEYLSSQVLPEKGYTVDIKWGSIGKKLLETGAIDLEKYKKIYTSRSPELLKYLTEEQGREITIDQKSAYFWVNTLWALGLVQKSKVLEEGIMGTEYKDRLGNFASTGGWTLGAKPAVELYSSFNILGLSDSQQVLVEKISRNIYRPCCNNPTSFPDCNHGMAALGLVELMVSQGFSEDEIYKAVLAFNSFWFPQTYLDLAYYFHKKENTLWANVDAKRVLSAEFSSFSGYQTVREAVGTIPGTQLRGGSCGA